MGVIFPIASFVDRKMQRELPGMVSQKGDPRPAPKRFFHQDFQGWNKTNGRFFFGGEVQSGVSIFVDDTEIRRVF